MIPEPAPPSAPALPPLAKLAVELGPLVVFFVVLQWGGIFVATGVLMGAMVVALGVSWRFERRLPPMSLVTLALVLGLGGLTLWLGDEDFIKLKPTIVSLLFAAVLAAGLFLRRPLLQAVLGSAFRLDEAGWRKLTLRWIGFFAALAAVNELARRQLSTEAWATFKVFGVLGLTVLFSALQIPLIQRHELSESQGAEGGGSGEAGG